jgi:hypothetical protein
MQSGKDFSILKWFIFPPLILALGAGISYFNITVFGLDGSILYLIALGAVNVVSLVLTRFTGSHKRPVRFASFIYECLLIAALTINISYSLSAQRDLSLVKQDGAQRREEIEEIGKLKSRKAQALLADKIGAKTDVRTAFGRYEAVLFWIMVAELAISFAALLTVYGLAAIKPGLRRVPRGAFRGTRPTLIESFPSAFVAAAQAERGAQIGFAPLKPPEAGMNQPEASSENFDNRPQGALAGGLRIIGQDSGVRIYDRNQYLGHASWSVYLSSVANPQQPTEMEIQSLINR